MLYSYHVILTPEQVKKYIPFEKCKQKDEWHKSYPSRHVASAIAYTINLQAIKNEDGNFGDTITLDDSMVDFWSRSSIHTKDNLRLAKSLALEPWYCEGDWGLFDRMEEVIYHKLIDITNDISIAHVIDVNAVWNDETKTMHIQWLPIKNNASAA